MAAPAKVRKTSRSWAFAAEPPWGIEPQTYALREARHSVPGTLPAQIAAHASPNAPSAQDAPDSRSTTRSTASARPSVTECYWMSDSTRARSSNGRATQRSCRSVQSTRARADQDMRSSLLIIRAVMMTPAGCSGGADQPVMARAAATGRFWLARSALQEQGACEDANRTSSSRRPGRSAWSSAQTACTPTCGGWCSARRTVSYPRRVPARVAGTSVGERSHRRRRRS